MLCHLLVLTANAGEAEPEAMHEAVVEGAENTLARDEDLSRHVFSSSQRKYMKWVGDKPAETHPEPAYRFLMEIHQELAAGVRDRPGVLSPFMVGKTVQGRPIWGFRIRRPSVEVHHRVLVFAGIHALEWVPAEVAASFILEMVYQPPVGVEVVVVPVLNVDGRRSVQQDLRAGENRYRRANANGVDLNRDFAVHRDSTAVWRHLLPGYYKTSPSVLSQPETQAIDRLAAEGFDVVVSLHAFGGFIYYPWAGRFSRPPGWRTYVELGNIMASGQSGNAYRVRELSRWGFFFRALGTDLDHMHGEHGAYSFLIELTRSGLHPLGRGTWKNNFRMYNPVDPSRHTNAGVDALRALVGALSWRGGEPLPQKDPNWSGGE